MFFLMLFAVPVVLALFIYAFWHHEITPTELAIQVGAMAIVAAIALSVVYHQNTDDYETLNGHVTAKHVEEVPCRHSYSCDCYTVCNGSGKTMSCHTTCSTCYEHHRWSRKIQGTDFDWILDTTLDDIYIDTIDRRGEREPPRYTRAKVMDPVSKLHEYENYIKAAPGTLLKHGGLTKKFASRLPIYPQRLYDYHYMDRIVTVGSIPLTNLGYWNRELARINDRLKNKQVNVIVVLANNQPQEYAYALEQHWVGGRKNDVIVVIGTNNTQVQWAYVMTWSKNEYFKVTLRNQLLELGSISDMHKVLSVIEDDTRKMFVRRSMKDFEYLKSSITPTTGQWTWSMIIGLIISIGLSILFAHPEIHISITGARKPGKKFPYEF